MTGAPDVDVIVVGGGHNGLVCAAYLAAAGVETLLLEARDSVGGCASTVEDEGCAARFNVCSCDHTLVRSMPFIDELRLADHGLRYAEADPPFVYTGYPGSRRMSSSGGSGQPGSAPWLFFNDMGRTVESIARHRRESAAAYERYCKDALPVAELVLELSTGAAHDAGDAGISARAAFQGSGPNAAVGQGQRGGSAGLVLRRRGAGNAGCIDGSHSLGSVPDEARHRHGGCAVCSAPTL